jgi:hypothetical protein
MSQVFNNLISNAIKFTKEGLIEISISKYNDYTIVIDKIPAILITIKDTGLGIPKEELETIFKEFEQSSRTKNYSGGKGLGLTICKRIINLHYGKIWASNEEKGAKINIILPVIHPNPSFLGPKSKVNMDDDIISILQKEIIELKRQINQNKLIIQSSSSNKNNYNNSPNITN